MQATLDCASSVKQRSLSQKPTVAAPTVDENTPPFSLATPAGRAAVAQLQEQLSADPDKARAFFQSAGILTKSGRLAKRYGG